MFFFKGEEHIYSLRPKIDAILGFKFCPTKNATLSYQL
jgi:hypothetical protein